MAFGMSLAVFSFVIEVTSFSRIVICKRGGRAELGFRARCRAIIQSLSVTVGKQWH